MRCVNFIGYVDPHLGAGSFTVTSKEAVERRTQLPAKLRFGVNRREPLLKLDFSTTPVPIFRRDAAGRGDLTSLAPFARFHSVRNLIFRQRSVE